MRISDWSSDVCSPDLVYETGRVLEAGCWAHARRHFYDIHEKRPSAITSHALGTIAELYRIEADIRGKPPDERLAVRQARAAPIVTALYAWLKEQLTDRESVVEGKSVSGRVGLGGRRFVKKKKK